MYLPDSSILTNIQVRGRARPLEILFEKNYITTRTLENRLYSDEEVMKLPYIPAGHIHYKEWQVRRRSSKRLLHYLATHHDSHDTHSGPFDVLEIGCGNGWLSHQVAEIPGTRVVGLDINFTELQQAARVFNDDPNLHFIQGDIRTGLLGSRRFDVILFPDSIQYFPSLKKIVHVALSYLKFGGEVHIFDSYFHKPSGIAMAKGRTLAYYTSLGYPEMADFYFHHVQEDLRSFHHHFLYNPHSVVNRLLGKPGDFPWIRIRK